MAHKSHARFVLGAVAAIIAAAVVTAEIPAPAAHFDPLTASKSTVALWMPDNQNGASGVIVAPGIILTAYHVVASGDQLTAETYDGAKFPVTTTWTDKTDDLALVSYKGDIKEPVAKLSCAPLETGEKLAAVGHPMMRAMWSITHGYVASTVTPRLDGITQHIVSLDLTIIPGNSGGPIYNDKGEVVAVSDAVLLGQVGYSASLTGLTFGVPVSDLCASLPHVA